jgi:hypothetical protein
MRFLGLFAANRLSPQEAEYAPEGRNPGHLRVIGCRRTIGTLFPIVVRVARAGSSSGCRGYAARSAKMPFDRAFFAFYIQVEGATQRQSATCPAVGKSFADRFEGERWQGVRL